MPRSGVKLSILSSYDKSGTDQAEKALERFAKKYGQVDKETQSITLDNTTESLARQSIAADQLAAKWSSAGETLKNVGSTLTTSVTVPLGAVGAASFTLASNFETSMSRVAGALNDPSANMQELSDLALQMGQDTIFSASEAGAAMEELAKGGLTAADIKGGALKTTMDLAAAGNLNLADAANTVVQSMGAFGLTADQTGEAANALAGAAAASSADVSDLTQGLSQVSAQANSAGWSIQDTTAVLGAFADAGIRGSDAGTSLKTMLQRLSAPTGAAAAQMEALGINVRDSDGNMKDAASIAGELQSKLSGLDSATRDAAIQTIFGADASRAALVMMNQGTAGIEKYTAATNDQEAAQRLANSQMGDSARAIEEMKGAVETAAIQIGTALAPVVTDVAGAVGSLAESFSELDPETQKMVVGFAAAAAAAGPVVTGMGHMASAGSSVISLYADITARMAQNSAAAAANATSTSKLGTAFGNARSKVSGFLTTSTALRAGLIGLGVVLTGLAVGAIADYIQSQEEMEQATDGLRNAQVNAISSSQAVGTALGNLETAYAGVNTEAENATSTSYGVNDAYAQQARNLASTSAAIDQLVASQANMAASIQENFSSMYASNAQLDVYRNTINDLANQSGLTAQEQAQLQTAVDGLNSACGTSYSVIDAANGVIADQEGVAMDTTDAINELVDAKQREAQAEALNSAYTESLKAQQDAATQLANALDIQAEKQRAYDEEVANGGLNAEEYARQLQAANDEVARAQGVYDSAAASANGYMGQMNLLTMAEQQGANSNAAWLAQQSMVGAIMTSNGQDVSWFAQQLDNAGISVSDMAGTLQASGITLEEMAAAYDGSLTSIANLCQDKGVEIPQALRDGIMNGSSEVANATGVLKEAMVLELTGGDVELAAELLGHDISQGLKDGITGSADMPQEAIGQMSEETINKAKEEFQSHSPSQVMYQLGFDINQGLANGINENSFSPLGAVQSLGQLLLSGFSGLASGGYTAGFNLVNSFTSSIGLNSPLATSAAGSLAFGAAGAALANSSAYGAGQNLSSTMSSGISMLAGTVSGTARSMASGGANSALGSSNASSAGRNLSTTFATSINSFAAQQNARSMANQSKSAAQKAADASSAGSNLSRSFANGIDICAAVDRAAQLARNALNAAKNALGIASPSKEFTALGEFSGEGFARGFDRSSPAVAAASREMAVNALNEAQGVMAGASISSGASGSYTATSGSSEITSILNRQYETMNDLLYEVRTLRSTLGQIIRGAVGNIQGMSFASENEAARWVQRMARMNV